MKELKILKEKLHNEKNSTVIESLFLEFSKQLMNNYSLYINTKKFEFTELEFYYFKCDVHEDTHIHLVEKQKEELKLYVHKKNWPRGGIDLTFGDDSFYGGILIRGVKTLKETLESKKETYYSGPAIVREEITSSLNIENNHEYLKRFFDTLDSWKIGENQEVLHSKRVGLGEGNKLYKNSLYRFVRMDFLENKENSPSLKTEIKAISHLTMGYKTGEKSAINKVIADEPLMKNINKYKNLSH